MALSDHINTFGQYLLERHGERIHKIALDAGFTCPNRDGAKGIGGCTFCNNSSFSPNGPEQKALETQLDSGRRAITKRTRAKKYLAYFQAYTNTYADVAELDAMYREAMTQHDIVGLSVGTRPDCVSGAVLDLLAGYREEGRIVWLELGLQSAFDETLRRVNRGHGLKEYRDVAVEARRRDIPLCTHLILGLPGEDESHYHASLDTVLDIGVDGLKLHPLHVVKHTVLANQWRRGEYRPLGREEYIRHACDLIERTPEHIVFHRVTGTASKDILLAPEWCSQKWNVLNGIELELKRRGHRQGCLAGMSRIEATPGKTLAQAHCGVAPNAPNLLPTEAGAKFLERRPESPASAYPTIPVIRASCAASASPALAEATKEKILNAA
ncbi:MAG: TIGR01212 family radical SAM protein [Candidatus Ferrigenium altingense]|jgi:radical SAM protein (TIGR01212 family)